jgi:hypothetical protein
VGQHFYVYDEEKLIDSLVASWPAGLVAERDSLKIYSLGKRKVKHLNSWVNAQLQYCHSQESLKKAEANFLKEKQILVSTEDLLLRIIPVFDSIFNLAVTERIQQFTVENDVPLVPAHAVLYKDEGSIDLSYPLVEILQKTETDQLAIKSYKAWLTAEIIRLELDEWLTGFVR